MRTKNSLINLIVSWLTQIFNVLLQFGLRTIFIQVLTTEYLGLNGLFSNILSYLSFAELGFGTAITFSLYKPLAENNDEAVAGIMNFFKKVYYIVGSFVLVVGIALTPLLPYLISEMPDIPHIRLIYILWVINSGSSYFFVYKSTLIIADQRKDIVEKNNFAFKVVQLLAQVIILLATKNYILYLLIQIITTVGSNVSISLISNKRYRYLKQLKKVKINKVTLQEIKKNVWATLLHKIGAVVIFGTDNILLSKFFGLVVVGVYSNYYLIINTLSSLVGQIQSSIVASVGNLGALCTNDKKAEVFEHYYFLNFWIFSFTSTCVFTLINPFIKLWLGKEFLMPIYVIAILTINYFLTGFRSAAATFNNAFGLFWNTRKLPVLESALNILFSVILAKKMGYIGIFLGTTLSSVVTGLWYEPYILYKEGLKQSPIKYYKQMFEYFIVAITVAVLCNYFINKISFGGIGEVIIKFIVTGIASNVLLFLIYFKTKKMEYLKDLLNKINLIVKHK